jgi:hypothetical protein
MMCTSYELRRLRMEPEAIRTCNHPAIAPLSQSQQLTIRYSEERRVGDGVTTYYTGRVRV